MIYSKHTLKWVVLILLLIVILYIYFNKSENFTTSMEAIQNVASVYTDISDTAIFNNITVNCSIHIGKYVITSDSSGNLLITDISNNIIFKSNADKSITMNLTNSNILNGTLTNTIGTNVLLKGGGIVDTTGNYKLTIDKSPWVMPNTTPTISGGGPPHAGGSHPVNTTGGALAMFMLDGRGNWIPTTTNIPNGVYASGGGDSYMIVEPWGISNTGFAGPQAGLSIYYPGTSATDPPFKVGSIWATNP